MEVLESSSEIASGEIEAAEKECSSVEAKLEEQKMILDKRKTTRTALLREVHDLERDSAAIEKVARERFNMCKEGEIIIKYDR